MGAILMMSAKVTTLAVLKRKILWNKTYDVLISVYDVTSKVLSSDSNATVIWSYDQSLLTLSFLREKVSWPQFYKDLTRKTILWGGVLVQV